MLETQSRRKIYFYGRCGLPLPPCPPLFFPSFPFSVKPAREPGEHCKLSMQRVRQTILAKFQLKIKDLTMI